MGLFDFIFNRTKKPITSANGVTGVGAFGGKLITYERSPDLQGRNLYLTLTNMVANTISVGAAVRYYQNLIGGASWSVEPKEGTGAIGQKAADLVKSGLFEANMPDAWGTCVKRQSLYRMFGFAAHEWTMRKRPKDGMLIFNSIEHRPQATIEFWDMPDKGGPLNGFVQRPLVWGDYYYVPRNRCWYLADNSLTESPDGVGVLRHVIEHSRRLDRYEQLEGFGYETDMRGIPVGRIPYQWLAKYASDNNKDAAWLAAQTAPLEKLVANHIKNPWQGITMDSIPYMTDSQSPTISPVPQFALELLKGSGTGLTEVNNVIERLNREIMRVLGMEFLLMGGDGKGSLAMHRDKTSMFATSLEAALADLAWSAVHDLVYPLLEMNGIDPEQYAPQVMPDSIATERIEVTVDALFKLAQAGAVLMPDDPAIDQIRRRLHLAEQPKLPPEVLGTLARPRMPFSGQPDDQGGGGSPSGAGAKPGISATKPRSTKGTFRKQEY